MNEFNEPKLINTQDLINIRLFNTNTILVNLTVCSHTLGPRGEMAKKVV